MLTASKTGYILDSVTGIEPVNPTKEGKEMSNLTKVLAITLCLICYGCSLTEIDGGQEAVFTYQPYFSSTEGVDKNPASAGAVWTVFTTKVDYYNIKPVKIKERFVDLTASDNVAIDFDVYLTLQNKKGQTPVLHEESGQQWYNNKVKDTFRAFVRNEARTRTSIELRTDEVVIKSVQRNVRKLTADYIKEIKLPVDVVKVNVGKVVPPEEVLAEAAQTAAQKQRKQTQEQRTLAETARAAAETATALADKAYSSQFNMTTDQFLKNKELELMGMLIKKDGANVSLIMNASDAKPMMRVGGWAGA